MKPRIAIGGIEQETCGLFISERGPLYVSYEEFTETLRSGPELLGLGDSNTIVDGFVRGTKEEGMEVVPLLWANALTGPPLQREGFERLVGQLEERLRKSLPVDGVLLSLHGSFAAEGLDDADGEVLRRVRKLVGTNCPIMAVHDLHANLTESMAQQSSVMVVERTYPHVDMAERGIHTSRLMAQTVRGTHRPTMRFLRIPILWSACRMMHSESPMKELIEKLQEIDRRPGVLSCSVAVGYQWIDSPCVGASVTVITDQDLQQADTFAKELGFWIWERKTDWCRSPLTPEEAIQEGEAIGRYPVLLAEQGDNPGGGAPGDATEILHLLKEHPMRPSLLLYMVDPEVARKATMSGQGAIIDINLGGKSHPRFGPPVVMRAKVHALCDGSFRYDGPMWKGVEADLGPTAWIEENGIHVVVISQRHQPIDLALCRKLGIDVTSMRIIVVKSTGHFRSGFGSLAGSIFNVDTTSALCHDFSKIPYRRLGRKMYPRDLDATWEWSSISSH